MRILIVFAFDNPLLDKDFMIAKTFLQARDCRYGPSNLRTLQAKFEYVEIKSKPRWPRTGLERAPAGNSRLASCSSPHTDAQLPILPGPIATGSSSDLMCSLRLSVSSLSAFCRERHLLTG
jgi:hypothetical protein